MVKRALFFACLLVSAVSVLLLLNVTAPNPTGRRYASAPTVWNNGRCDGKAAENILAQDLNLVHNEKVEKTQCVCQPNLAPNALPSICGVCSAYSSHVSPRQRAHVPDFVSPHFIADAKCVTNLTTNTNQLEAFADMSEQLGVPFWIFVRMDTEIAPRYIAMTRASGGDVVRYFLTPGYVDPVDVLAKVGLLISLLGILALLYSAYRGRRPRPNPSTKPTPSPPSKAQKAIQEAEDFKNKRKDRLRAQLDDLDNHNERKP